MVQVFGIAILWIAVMSALQKSEITKAVVEPIAAFGKSVGELAAKAPSYAPIIPTPG
jgi:malonyl CoA-acyl carrier protein transacylase